jgi:acyl carrier protein
VANTQVYVLDAWGQSTPLGVPGELYIGGADLALGYLNRPELTAAAFIPDPFGRVPGARLYKTGDLVRYLPDGLLQFMGRIDYQVKLRGFRIEPGEVESVLGEHPAVHQAVVVCVTLENMPGNNQLVACIVPSQTVAPTAGDLRDFLKKKLPDYAIPSAFLILETLPLTTSGKVDRQTLLALAKSRPQSEEARVAPRTAIEKTLADIWAQVMNLEKIGIYDNFFDLGGHSLVATQIIYRINHAFRLTLPLRSIFEESTIAGLALLVEERILEEIAPQTDHE